MRGDSGDDNSNNKKQQDGFALAFSYLSQIGISIIACIAVGILLGIFIDSLIDTTPWFLLLFTLLGMAAAFKSIYDFANKH